MRKQRSVTNVASDVIDGLAGRAGGAHIVVAGIAMVVDLYGLTVGGGVDNFAVAEVEPDVADA